MLFICRAKNKKPADFLKAQPPQTQFMLRGVITKEESLELDITNSWLSQNNGKYITALSPTAKKSSNR
jgi:hypothetical protein